MFIHIDKLLSHTKEWLVNTGHKSEDVVDKAVNDLLNHILARSQEEAAVEFLTGKGYTVTAPPVSTAMEPAI